MAKVYVNRGVTTLNEAKQRQRRVIFGLALERFIVEQGLIYDGKANQSEFARRLRAVGYPGKMTPRTVNNWVTGESEPRDPKTLIEYLEMAFDVTEEQSEYLPLALVNPRRYARRFGLEDML